MSDQGAAPEPGRRCPAPVDYVEVGRKAHELEASHGGRAWDCAARLALEASEAGESAEAEFWRAVSASLQPRGGGRELG